VFLGGLLQDSEFTMEVGIRRPSMVIHPSRCVKHHVRICSEGRAQNNHDYVAREPRFPLGRYDQKRVGYEAGGLAMVELFGYFGPIVSFRYGK